jgi:hypothetical protein
METPLEKILVSTHKPGMIAFLDAHPECFKEAINLAISEKQPYAWRASWVLWSYMKTDDTRVKPFLKKIIHAIEGKPQGQQRELLKIIYFMELSEENEGPLFDICTKIWLEIKKSPSVRMNSLKVLVKIAQKHPALKEEILFLTRKEYLETLSPGVKRSISKLIQGNL